VGVDVPDLSRSGGVGHGDNLIPGGDDGRLRSAINRDIRQSQASEQTDVLGKHALSRGNHDIAARHIFRLPEDVFPRRDRMGDLDGAFSCRTGIFHHDHGIRALRKESPCRDRRCLMGADAHAGDPAHHDGSDKIEERGQRVRGSEGVRGTNGVTVHGRTGQGREILRRRDIHSTEPVEGIVQRDGFNGKAPETGERLEYPLRRGHCKKFGHDLHPPVCKIPHIPSVGMVSVRKKILKSSGRDRYSPMTGRECCQAIVGESGSCDPSSRGFSKRQLLAAQRG